MLLAIDIGNSGVKCAVYDGSDRVAFFRLATTDFKTSYEYKFMFQGLLGEFSLSFDDINSAILSTVVPSTRQTIVEVFRFLGIPLLVVGPGIKTGIKLRIEAHDSLGADLLCNAVAGHALAKAQAKEQGGVQKAALVIAFGTALTYTVVNSKNELVGVSIAPGLGTSIRALVGKTAMLPMIPEDFPQTLIGRNTVSAMQAGTIGGMYGAVKYMIESIRSELGEELEVYTTGHEAQIFPELGNYIPHLTTEGLRILAELNRLPIA